MKHLRNNSKETERDRRKETLLSTIQSMNARPDKPLDIAMRNLTSTVDFDRVPTSKILSFKSVVETKPKAASRVATCEDLQNDYKGCFSESINRLL